MKKRTKVLIEALIVMLAIVVIIFGGVYTLRVVAAAKKLKHFAQAPPSKVAVSAQVAQALTWHPKLSAVASLEAVQGVEVTPGLGGLVSTINFHSGDFVHEGDLLVQLNVAQDKAQLQGLEAQERLNQVSLKRQSTLYKRRAASKSELDKAQAQYDKSRADVAAQKAVIAKKTIRAPFTGVIGIREVDLGQYIQAGTAVATLQSLQPLYVDFSLPQQELPKVRTGQKVELLVDTYPGKTFTAKVTAITPKVNATTRNFRIRAALKNTDKLLRPGMFGHVQVVLPAKHQVITLPQSSISHQAYGDLVYIVTRNGKPVMGMPGKDDQSRQSDDKNGSKAPLKVKSVFVTTGATRGDQVAIKQGVKAGQLVVTSGQLKLKNGALIKINNTLEPPNAANPNPPEE